MIRCMLSQMRAYVFALSYVCVCLCSRMCVRVGSMVRTRQLAISSSLISALSAQTWPSHDCGRCCNSKRRHRRIRLGRRCIDREVIRGRLGSICVRDFCSSPHFQGRVRAQKAKRRSSSPLAAFDAIDPLARPTTRDRTFFDLEVRVAVHPPVGRPSARPLSCEAWRLRSSLGEAAVYAC